MPQQVEQRRRSSAMAHSRNPDRYWLHIDDKIILRARQNELKRLLEKDTSVDNDALVLLAKEAFTTEKEGLLEQHKIFKRKRLEEDEAKIMITDHSVFNQLASGSSRGPCRMPSCHVTNIPRTSHMQN